MSVQFTSDGDAWLNFNGSTYCNNPGCTGGVVPYQLSGVYSSAPYGVGSNAKHPNGRNTDIVGLDGQMYARGGAGQNGVISNVSKLYAVQADGTIIGNNGTTDGCFNNNG